jgi:hypothetical protein
MISAVVIPIYKQFIELSKEELSSLNQVLETAHNHNIVIACHEAINFKDYSSNARTKKVELNVIHFDKSYFENIKGYNRLMLNVDFYKAFKNFEYILIYQLDAWLFYDHINLWCEKGYDYIGAPWLETNVRSWVVAFPWKLRLIYNFLYLFKPMKFVGNGGFSLRKVSSCISFLQKQETLAKKWACNEDLFWSYATILDKKFRIPEHKEALSFSFEFEPILAYKLNHEKLPMGCHAWGKYKPEFWREKINVI